MKNIHKNKFTLILKHIAVLLIVLLVSFACQPKKEKTYLIGILNPNPGAKAITNGFIESMKAFGYIEGKNVTYIRSESKNTIGKDIKNMVDKPVDLLLTVTTPATRKAKEATEGTDIPVIFVMHDPVASGIVRSLADPGGNLTGVKLRGSTPKTLEWLLTAVPGTKHLFVPLAFDTKAARQSLKDLQQASDKLDVRLTVSEVNTVEEMREALSSVPDSVDALFVLHSILIVSNLNVLISAAEDLKMPIVSSGHEHYKKGVAVSYGHRNTQVGRQVSRLADKLIKGVPPGNLPVEAADYFLGINLRTAGKIGLEFSDAFLKQADNIIR
jgi:putative ABC transport system substrate-binding protein